MLARLQRAWVAVLAVSALLCAGLVLHASYPWWVGLICALVVLHIHALALAVEFVLLARVNPGPGVPKPDARALFAAWWGEIWTGLRVFCWRQPFRADTHPDRLQRSATGRRGVILIHGFVCNRGLWNPWMSQLSALDVPHIAVNLEPVFGSINRYVRTLDDAVAQMQVCSGREPVLVAHSMGGLAVRAWLQECQADHRIHSVVTIGTPHSGTWLARYGLSTNAQQMRLSSAWLQALAAQERPARRALFTCFFGHCDNIVVPATTATLADADNRHIPGVAHVHLAFQPVVFDEVLRRL
jgi:pimeloyl-ACP methyl ester carboxylesterase